MTKGKKFAIIALTLFVLLVAGGYLFLRSLPLRALRGALGPELSIGRYLFNPFRKIRIEDLEVGSFARVEGITVTFSLPDLIRKREVRRILAEGISIDLDSLPKSASSGERGGEPLVLPRLRIREISLKDLRVKRGGEALSADSLNASLQMGGTLLFVDWSLLGIESSRFCLDSLKGRFEKRANRILLKEVAASGPDLEVKLSFSGRGGKYGLEASDIRYGKEIGAGKLQVTLNTADSTFRINVRDLRFRDETFERFLFLGKFRGPDTLYLSDFLASKGEGFIEGKGLVSLRGPWMEIHADVRGIAFHRDFVLGGRVDLTGKPGDFDLTVDGGYLNWKNLSLDGIYLSGEYDGGLFRADELRVENQRLFLTLRGTFSASGQDLDFRTEFLDLSLLDAFGVKGIEGTAKLRGRVFFERGKLVNAEIAGSSVGLAFRGLEAGTTSVYYEKKVAGGKLSLSARHLAFQEIQFDSFNFLALFGEKSWFAARAEGKDALFNLRGRWRKKGRAYVIELTRGQFRSPPLRVALGAPVRFEVSADTVYLSGDDLYLGKDGIVRHIEGFIRRGKDEVSLEVDARDFDLSYLRRILGAETPLEGNADFRMTLEGALSDPYIIVDASLEKPIFGDFAFDSLELKGRYGSGSLVLSNLKIYEGGKPSWAYAEIPALLSLSPLHFEILDSGLIRSGIYTEGIDPTPFLKHLGNFLVVDGGVLTLDFRVEGDVKNPVFSGHFSLKAREGTITSINSYLSDFYARGHFEDEIVFFDTISGLSEKGRLLGFGRLRMRGLAADSLDLTFRVRKIPVSFGPDMNGIASGTVVLRGPLPRFWIIGDIYLDEFAFVAPFGRSGGGGGPSPSPVRYRLRIKADNNVFLLNELAEMEFSADLELKKEDDINTLLSGKLELLGGSFLYLDRNFNLTGGEVVFYNQREINPTLDIEGETTVAESILITLKVQGTLQEPEIHLTSTPPLSEEDIISYLSFGKPFNEVPLSLSDLELIKRRALNLAEGIISKELRRRLRIQELEVTTGLAGEDPRFTVGFYLSRNFYLRYTHDILAVEKDVFQARYRLSRRVSLYAERDKEGAFSAGLELTLRF